MADYGIKISKAGFDITDVDPENYHFWSKYRNKSIKTLVALNVTTTTDEDASAVTNNYPHAFGYIPQFMVFVTTAINSVYVNCDYNFTTTYGKDGDYQEEILTCYATSSHIYVSALWDYYTPMSGAWTGLANTYTFDIILFMEEVETS